jgi:hypothetical protein
MYFDNDYIRDLGSLEAKVGYVTERLETVEEKLDGINALQIQIVEIKDIVHESAAELKLIKNAIETAKFLKACFKVIAGIALAITAVIKFVIPRSDDIIKLFK